MAPTFLPRREVLGSQPPGKEVCALEGVIAKSNLVASCLKPRFDLFRFVRERTRSPFVVPIQVSRYSARIANASLMALSGAGNPRPNQTLFALTQVHRGASLGFASGDAVNVAFDDDLGERNG